MLGPGSKIVSCLGASQDTAHGTKSYNCPFYLVSYRLTAPLVHVETLKLRVEGQTQCLIMMFTVQKARILGQS